MSSINNHSFHDAEIIHLFVKRENEIACIGLELPNKNNIFLIFEGLKLFRSEDFVMQNVISRIIKSSDIKISKEDLLYWIEWATSSSDSNSYLNQKYKDFYLSSLKNKTLELIVFEPSIGAQIVLICEKMIILDSFPKHFL